MNHNSYITVKRAKFKTISGEVNIPYGTKLEVGGNVLLHNGKPVCAVFSDCAYEFFAQNDDGQGLLRGKLIQTIKSTLAKHDEAHQDRWDKIWDDPRCQQYKCSDRDDFWLWNHDFYMVGTGLRVGEVTGLRWCDIDLDEGVIDVNHTLVYYEHRSDEGKRGCYFNVNTPKTPTSNRQVPMLDFVKEAFLIEKKNQELLDLHCQVTIDGYSDFIFINRFGQAQHQGTLNKALRRIIRDCNDEQLLKDENTDLLLPHFSCHSLRHTFTTRMCEAGVNVKVIQDTLGHKDISTTLNIYTDVTKELKRSEFEGLDLYFKAE